jgi:FAD/FMN-containing dehydrogenase
MPQRVLTFAPRHAGEAAEIFSALSRLAGAGRTIRAGIVESPFRPAAGVELPGTTSSPGEIESAVAGGAEALALLSHVSMGEIHEISRSDFLAVVGGGVKFGVFADEVRKAGLYFPHESDAWTREATVAEIIMDGAIFRTEGRYGRLREYVLSLELVTPKGDVVRHGSRSVKDVTGYDVAGFLMGGGGLCGMIAKATLRLLPARGTRIHFLCAGGRQELEALGDAAYRKIDCAFLEMFPDAEGSPARARLAGEMQSAVRGREDVLLEQLSGLAPKDVLALRVEPETLEECRRIPDAALERLKEGERFFHVSSSVELAPSPSAAPFSYMSLFPARFHYFVSGFGGLAGPLAYGGDVRVEAIEMRGGCIIRRRLPRDEIIDAMKGGAGALSGTEGAAESAAGAGPSVLDELARRLYRVFDPQGIMLP